MPAVDVALELAKVALPPAITAVLGWYFGNVDVFSLRKYRKLEGAWYAYYRNPIRPHGMEQELWTFTKLGNVEVRREGKLAFAGRVDFKAGKVFMRVTSIDGEQRFLVMIDPPYEGLGHNAKCISCIWLGEGEDKKTTAGHAMLSRKPSKTDIKAEFLRAQAYKLDEASQP